MNKNKKDKNRNKMWIQYGVFSIVVISLYATGLHTEVIGFAQRGLLITGLMNPNIEEIAKFENSNYEAKKPRTYKTKIDYNFMLTNKEGHQESLEKFKEKVIFLNYWATWCPPCIAEMPSIHKLHEQMGEDVAFIMLSFDHDFKKAIEFDDRKGYGLPIYAPVSNLPSMLQSSALPTTYIIDKEGNIVLSHKGMADYNSSEFKEFLMGLQ